MSVLEIILYVIIGIVGAYLITDTILAIINPRWYREIKNHKKKEKQQKKEDKQNRKKEKYKVEEYKEGEY